MKIRSRRSGVPLPIALLVLGTLAGCGGATTKATSAASVPASTSSTTALSVKSSIVDGAALAQPLAWTASTSNIDVDHIDFLIDNALKWTEKKTPYTFNDDGNWLHPWLLGPGPHLLTVRAVISTGAQATSSAHVTVTSGPQVPPGLAGSYTRSVTPADVARVQSYRTRADAQIGLPPTGVWTVHFQPNGLILFDDPKGSGGDEAFSAAPAGTLRMEGPANWLVPTDRQGSFCVQEPPGQYHWSLAGNALTITGDRRECADRDVVFIGTWARS